MRSLSVAFAFAASPRPAGGAYRVPPHSTGPATSVWLPSGLPKISWTRREHASSALTGPQAGGLLHPIINVIMSASNRTRIDIMPLRTTKSIRITEDAQRLLRLVAAFEDRTEGAIVEGALAAYLQIRSLGYGSVLPEARELAHTTSQDVGETVARLTSAIENALADGRVAPRPGAAKQRLRERDKQRAA